MTSKHTYCPDCGARDDQDHYKECEPINKICEIWRVIEYLPQTAKRERTEEELKIWGLCEDFFYKHEIF